MTDGGASFLPGQEDSVPTRPRSFFVGHEVFGHGPGAVLVEPDVARDLRSAAELATQERRITGGLLYGRPWADDEGPYLVVDGFLKAGPGENPDDEITADGRDGFALSAADLRLLRADAARLYSAAIEVGWWRSLPGPGEFGLRDYESQAELVGPGGVGLLVFGSGLDWGTAYLGPDSQLPGSARSFIPVPRPADEEPRLLMPGESLAEPDTALEDDEDDEDDDLLDDADLEPEPVPAGVAAGRAPAPQSSGPPVISPVRVPAREWGGAKLANPGYAVGSRVPTDVKIVVGMLAAAIIVAAIIIGALFHSAIIALIVAVVALLLGGAVIWASRT